jgi:hypothetical protein
MRLSLSNREILLAALIIANFYLYPMFAVLTAILDLNSFFASIPVRLICFVIPIIFLANRWRFSNKIPFFLTYFFFFICSIRLLFEGFFNNSPKSLEYFLFFLAFSIIPALSIMDIKFSSRFYRYLTGKIVAISFLTNFLIIFTLLDHSQSNQYLFLISRRLSFLSLDPISLGHFAVSGIISSILYLSFSRNFLATIFILINLTMAFSILLLSASKGPIIALIGCFSISLIFLPTEYKKNKNLGIVLITTAIIVYLIFQSPLVPNDLFLFERFVHFTQDESYSDRISLLISSFENIKANPFFGSVNLINNNYPHNFLIEATLLTGLSGSLLYLSIIGYAFYKSVMLIYEGKCLLISIFFLQYLISSFLSGSVFLANFFWILIVIIFSSPIKSRNHSHRFT